MQMTERRLPEARVYVWDRFVRIGHWTLAIGFFTTYLSDEPLTLHVWVGYYVGALILARVAWGFFGPEHARFRDFLYRPSAVHSYLRDLLPGRAPRHLGHSPAGGAMVILLLVAIAGTTITGLALDGADRQVGPLAPYFATAAPARPEPSESRRDRRTRSPEARRLKDLHELFANGTLALVLFHIGGVVLANFAHRENLVGSMLTGYKRPLKPGS
jgi:cytochrome b